MQICELSQNDLQKLGKILSEFINSKMASNLSMLINDDVKFVSATPQELGLDDIEKIIPQTEVQENDVGMYITCQGEMEIGILFHLPLGDAKKIAAKLLGSESNSDLSVEGKSSLTEISNIMGASFFNILNEKTGCKITSSVPGLAIDTIPILLESPIMEAAASNTFVYTYGELQCTESKLKIAISIFQNPAEVKSVIECYKGENGEDANLVSGEAIEVDDVIGCKNSTIDDLVSGEDAKDSKVTAEENSAIDDLVSGEDAKDSKVTAEENSAIDDLTINKGKEQVAKLEDLIEELSIKTNKNNTDREKVSQFMNAVTKIKLNSPENYSAYAQCLKEFCSSELEYQRERVLIIRTMSPETANYLEQKMMEFEKIYLSTVRSLEDLEKYSSETFKSNNKEKRKSEEKVEQNNVELNKIIEVAETITKKYSEISETIELNHNLLQDALKFLK